MGKSTLALIYVVLFSLFWALNISLTRVVLRLGVSPYAVTLQAAFAGAGVLLLYILLLKRKAISGINFYTLKMLFFSGVGITMGNLVGNIALNYTSSINFGFLVKTTIIFTILFAYLFLGERLSREKLVLMVTLLFGVYLVSTGGERIMPRFGDLLVLLAASGLSASAIFLKKVLKEMDSEVAIAIRSVAILLVVSVTVPFIDQDFLSFKFPLHIFLIGATSALTGVFISRTLALASASYMTMMSMLTPVIVTVLGTFWLNETMNILQISGGIIIIGSGVLVYKFRI